jgi:hypothetical protein
LIVHQFTEGMVRDRSEIVERPGLAIVSNVDGYGAPAAKTGVYGQLTRTDVLPRAAGASFTGFKLFLREDSDLMDPAAVLALRPQPSVVIYE